MRIPPDKTEDLKELVSRVYSKGLSLDSLGYVSQLCLRITDSDYYSNIFLENQKLRRGRIFTNNTPEFNSLYSRLAEHDYIFDKMYSSRAPATLIQIVGRIDNPDIRDEFSVSLQKARPASDICYVPLIISGHFLGFFAIGREGLYNASYSGNDIETFCLCCRIMREGYIRALRSELEVLSDAVLDGEGNLLASGAVVRELFRRVFGEKYRDSPAKGPAAVHEAYKAKIRSFLSDLPTPGSGSWHYHGFGGGYWVQLEKIRNSGALEGVNGAPRIALSVSKSNPPLQPGLREINIRKNLNLTETELLIIERICRGMSNADIADSLSISEETAKRHVYNIFRKTGVKKRTRLILSLMS